MNWPRIFPHVSKDLVRTDLSHFDLQLAEIRRLEAQLSAKTSEEIHQAAEALRRQAKEGKSLDELLPESYALVSEAAFRTLGMRPYNVQVLAAIALHQGQIVEMRTGEGKTLAATLPAFLNSLPGHGVHILTFNDYLAARDAKWMRPVYEFLGASLGWIQEDLPEDGHRQAYAADITYVTAREAGFDYLRDLQRFSVSDFVQRRAAFLLVDEADSILIDEARTPLVIAGAHEAQNASQLYALAALVKALVQDLDFQSDEHGLNIFLTEKGIQLVEAKLGIKNLYATDNQDLLALINTALHAQCLLLRDVDYIVREMQIELVDEFTGRVMENRKWPHGLQAAIEAKENLPIQPEGEILGQTTLRHFVQNYPKISGMTGTAAESAAEFHDFYGLEVTIIPPHLPSQRRDDPDLVFPTNELRDHALLKEIKEVQASGRPILVGTRSVKDSDRLAARLAQAGISFHVLNARNDAEEANIIAQAGIMASVTISTNMAGRGTDIQLGGEAGLERPKLKELGGLYVIGTSRFESKRIDNQLRGRAGRQGDPGSTKFFISLEDPLLIRYGIADLLPKRIRKQKDAYWADHPRVRKEIDHVQRIAEGKNTSLRKTLWKYASFTDMQWKILHKQRMEVLTKLDFESLVQKMDPKAYAEVLERSGQKAVRLAEAQITMALIDRHWAKFLEDVNDIRQGIHLSVLGGRDPFQEFQKASTARFEMLLISITDSIVSKFKVAQIGPSGIDLQKEGLKGPASTWTYLINDNPFGDKLEMMMIGNSQFGFQAGAALYWPLLMAYFLVKRIFRKRD